MKGTQRISIKIKLISIINQNTQNFQGESIINIDQKIIQNSQRVLIYDKNNKNKEAVICSIDMYVSGIAIQKKSNGLNKTNSKIQESKEQYDDLNISQRSYTIQQFSQRSQKQQYNNYKQQPIYISPINYNKNQKNYLNRRQVINKYAQNQYSSRSKYLQLNSNHKKIQQQQQQQSQYDLNNQNRRYNKDYNIFNQQNIKSKQSYDQSQSQRINQHKQTITYRSHQKQQQNMNSQIKAQLEQNQKIMIQLKRYLKNRNKSQQQQQKQQKYSDKNKNRYRRKTITIQTTRSHEYQNNFIQYFKNIDNQRVAILKNLQLIKMVQYEPNQYKQVLKQVITKVIISNIQNQDILIYDAEAYRSYCHLNAIKQNCLSMYIPFDEISLKIEIQLKDCRLEGILGLQQGQNMAIRLFKIDDQQKYNSVKEQFKLYCDIKLVNNINVSSSKKLNEPLVQNQELFMDKLDIKKKVETLSLQPWAYKKLSSEGIQNNNKIKNNIIKQKEIIQEQEPSLIHISVSKQSQSQDKKYQNNNKFLKKQSLKHKVYKYATSDDNQRQSFYQQKSSFKKRKSAYDKIKDNSDISQINNIRNGNRNNYKFKTKPKNSIKQIWQELLLKKKHSQEKKMNIQLQLQRKKMNKYIANRKNSIASSFSSVIKQDQDQKYKKIRLQSLKTHLSPQQYNIKYNIDKTQYPNGLFSLEINNISITQPKMMIDQDLSQQTGKFIKISIDNNIDYFTQVAYNYNKNNILWKLSQCTFKKLSKNQKLSIHLYSTINNEVNLIGKALIRVQKLLFLRNNHIYNGKLLYNDQSQGQYTISFNIINDSPFEIVQQTQNQYLKSRKNSKLHNNNYDYIQMNRNSKMFDKMMNKNDLLNTMKKNMKNNKIISKIRSKIYQDKMYKRHNSQVYDQKQQSN